MRGGHVYWVEICVQWERRQSEYKGHSQFANNGTCCPFDFTKEDHSFRSSPYTPWGIWKHFRSREDIEPDLIKAISECDADAFESLMHQYQDTRTHYDKGYGWWTLGHLFAGTAPDMDNEAWALAEKDTRKFVDRWMSQCDFDKCECKWGRKK